MEEYKDVINSSNQLIQQENVIMPEDVCRDFLRNVCTRGNRCKYKHPRCEEEPKDIIQLRPGGMVFCHDFQNTVCTRLSCKFVHRSRQDEDYYKLTGELPKPNPELIISNGSQESIFEREVPLCKDFLKRECQRGKKCKFLHVSESRGYQNKTEEYDIPDAKRRHNEDLDKLEYGFRIGERMVANPSTVLCSHCKPISFHAKSHSFCMHTSGSNPLELCVLHEENLLLRKKVEDLKKQVGDLLATNEFLLEQNAHFRIQGKFSTSTSIATVTLPTVTLPSSVTVPVTTSVTALGPLGSLSSVQTAQALVTTQSRPTLTASIPFATSVPLNQPSQLATTIATTLGIAPVTINQTTALATQNPALSAATATVTLTPTINAAALQLQGPHLSDSALTFSASNGGSLVSYPIMTQSILAPSELRSTHCGVTDLFR